MLTEITRTDALAHARYVFRALASRAWDSAPSERVFVADLALSWDRKLEELIASAQAAPLVDAEAQVLDHLTSSATHPDLSASALVHWVDAFPAAVFDLFEQEYGQEAEVELDAPVDVGQPVRAANKQPQLALAA